MLHFLSQTKPTVLPMASISYLQMLDTLVVLWQRFTQGIFEVINCNEIREERENIFDFQQITGFLKIKQITHFHQPVGTVPFCYFKFHWACLLKYEDILKNYNIRNMDFKKRYLQKLILFAGLETLSSWWLSTFGLRCGNSKCRRKWKQS